MDVIDNLSGIRTAQLNYQTKSALDGLQGNRWLLGGLPQKALTKNAFEIKNLLMANVLASARSRIFLGSANFIIRRPTKTAKTILHSSH